MAALAPLALAATAIGGVVSAMGTLAAGADAKEAAYFKAAQEEQQAQESRAASQRSAMESRRQAQLAISKIQANSAAGGSLASSGNPLQISENVAARGEYQALADMYKGENRARGLEDTAMGSRMTGDAAERGATYKAFGTLLSTGGSMFDRFNKFYG